MAKRIDKDYAAELLAALGIETEGLFDTTINIPTDGLITITTRRMIEGDHFFSLLGWFKFRTGLKLLKPRTETHQIV